VVTVPEALAVRNLQKRYGSVHALRGVDLTVEEGQLVGLLGPNGAGKSTLVKIAAGLVRQSGGDARDVIPEAVWGMIERDGLYGRSSYTRTA